MQFKVEAICTNEAFVVVVNRVKHLTNGWNGPAIAESVARETGHAAADRRVADHSALGVGSARSRARINAFLVDTGLVGRAVRVDDALRTAVRRGADHSRNTATLGLSGNDLALRIRPTW